MRYASRGAAVAVTAGLLAYAVPAIALAGAVPRDTWVAGVNVGGLSEEQARTRLESALGRPLTLSAGGRTLRRAPARLGMTVDVPATVGAAFEGASTPAGVLRSLFGGGRRVVSPRVTLDETRLAAELAAIDVAPREGGVRYTGTRPRAVLPKPGRALDRAGAAAAVRQAVLAGRTSVTLTTRPRPAGTPAAEIRRVTGTLARAAVAAPLTLTNGGRKTTLSGSDVAAGLRWVADGRGGLRPSFDARDLPSDLGKRLVAAGGRPKDATFRIVRGRPRVVAARPGRGVDAKALGPAIATALATGRRSVEVPTADAAPRVTTELAGRLGVKEKVSTFTTRHPCCAPRVTNIHRIADLIDGYVVKPGETFSLNDVVGRRDRARGFVEAPMILNNRFVNDVGGGVSQFATTMFNAVFFGGFEDVQHRAHQYYISRYPAGRESTVSFPQPDFRWRNNSPYGVLIKTSYTGTSITVQFWSTRRYTVESRSSARYAVTSFPTLRESGKECIPMDGVEGFAIDVWRIFKKDGKEIRRQRFHTVYAPEPRLRCT
ncbi:Vancomycin resistance protein YoaR, contains peptidoglycan-binding and VanW domains [Nonomuraea solani]|uniref:Vancomycin resistance protein YoaR, contains peptidoglycan-binding and VanW domains n=1 Tax=Nonomuraea solani TaxID=1144553 RepID=A0A1H6EQQ4_9ACTN|nr:VanW family protein [Nonomuraea solani]SEH00142.1 Vancomycin resistance protein YoaR, contains peptidoglycan-binding and VanW domains [Nonomuraea solani]